MTFLSLSIEWKDIKFCLRLGAENGFYPRAGFSPAVETE